MSINNQDAQTRGNNQKVEMDSDSMTTPTPMPSTMNTPLLLQTLPADKSPEHKLLDEGQYVLWSWVYDHVEDAEELMLEDLGYWKMLELFPHQAMQNPHFTHKCPYASTLHSHTPPLIKLQAVCRGWLVKGKREYHICGETGGFIYHGVNMDGEGCHKKIHADDTCIFGTTSYCVPCVQDVAAAAEDEEYHICGVTGGRHNAEMGCYEKVLADDTCMICNTSYCVACFEKYEEELEAELRNDGDNDEDNCFCHDCLADYAFERAAKI